MLPTLCVPNMGQYTLIVPPFLELRLGFSKVGQGVELSPEERKRIVERELARFNADRRANRTRRTKRLALACLSCLGLALIVGVALLLARGVNPLGRTTARVAATPPGYIQPPTYTPYPTMVPSATARLTQTPYPTRQAVPSPTIVSALIRNSERANGYDWWAASEAERIELCRWWEANVRRAGDKSYPGWQSVFVGLNEFYRTDEPFILQQPISEVAVLLADMGRH